MRVVVAGVSHWHASMHIRALLAVGATIVGVSDRQRPLAERIGDELGCPAYSDYRAMLEACRPDFAMAMGQPNETGEMARYLLGMGVPFAAEKPLGVDAAHVAPLAELERERAAFAAVALVTRYSPIWATLEELRGQERLGALSHAHFRLINGPPTRYVRDGVGWMLDPAVAGGGPLMNLGIHCVDAFLRLVAEPVACVAAQVSYRLHGEAIEDFCTATLRSESGVIGTIEAGYTYPSLGAGGRPSGDREWRIAAGGAYLRDDGQSLRVVTADGQDEVQPCPSSSDHYMRFSVDTLERLQQGRPPVASIRDCYRAVALIDQIYERAGLQRTGVGLHAPEQPGASADPDC